MFEMNRYVAVSALGDQVELVWRQSKLSLKDEVSDLWRQTRGFCLIRMYLFNHCAHNNSSVLLSDFIF